jgi:hypothetical protein
MAVSASQPHATTPAQPDVPAIPGTNTRVPSGFQASVLIGLLLAVAAGLGLFIPGIYEADTAFAAAAFRGTDLVSLVVALPTLAGSLFLARRGSGRALLVWLGTLAYVTYTYLYSFAIVWNRLFLDANLFFDQFTDRTPVRSVSTFLWVIGAMLGLMELGQVMPAGPPDRRGSRRRGQNRASHRGHLHPRLGLVVPLLLLAGRWLRARRPWGYVAAGILLVKGVAVGLGLLSSNLFGYLDSGHTDGPLLGLWALIATASLLMLLRYLRAMHDQPIGPLANPAEHGHERN